jgi:transposase
MPERRRKFSPQFKAEAVQLVIETGKLIAEVAGDLGVNDGTLGNWVKAWRDANPESESELSPVERARMTELEGEIRRLRMENELTRKSAWRLPVDGVEGDEVAEAFELGDGAAALVVGVVAGEEVLPAQVVVAGLGV